MRRNLMLMSIINAQQQAAQAQQAKQAETQKAAVKYNQSYSSQEFADKRDQGSDFFNQTKQRGTLFGN